jgi:hypothetical protein
MSGRNLSDSRAGSGIALFNLLWAVLILFLSFDVVAFLVLAALTTLTGLLVANWTKRLSPKDRIVA